MAVLTDITDDIPSDIGPAVTSSAGSAQVPANIRWDCRIASLPFLFGMSSDKPMQRETADFRRQRIDSERNPGEQSLDSGLWIRSQATWHYGGGLSSAEPLEVSETESRFRFTQSGGVDIWTPGQASLLNSTSKVLNSAGSNQLLLGVTDGVLHASATTLTYIAASGGSTAVTWGGSTAITSMTTDGANYYVADTDGIWKGALNSGAGSKIWNTGSATVIRWVKSRLMATVGKGIYELTAAGPTLPTALDAGSARPSNWTWVDISESPQAIYFTGYAGDQSTIETVAVTSSASSIVLSQPVVIAEMPRGEVVKSLYAYVGRYLIIGTSKGVRVGAISTSTTADGALTIGPLIIETSDGSTDAVAIGPFVYVTVGSKGNAGDRAQRAGLWRLDLGTNLNQSALQFASAADLVSPSGTAGNAVQVTVSGTTLFFAVNSAGVFQQDSTYVSEGWLETGRIRLGTVENKAWRDIRLLGVQDMDGTVAAYASFVDSGTPSTWGAVISSSGTAPDSTGGLSSVAPSAQPSMYVAFKLATTDTAVSPLFVGYQLRAIPAPRRTQLVSVPLLCYDWEIDKNGSRVGHLGSSWERYGQLKTLEGSASTVIWQDYTTGERAEAYVEKVAMVRQAPPSGKASGAGGVVTVLLRLV